METKMISTNENNNNEKGELVYSQAINLSKLSTDLDYISSYSGECGCSGDCVPDDDGDNP